MILIGWGRRICNNDSDWIGGERLMILKVNMIGGE